jgi:quinoprotein dehydrogenase-associated probable ABC transporter substrate-binding protein
MRRISCAAALCALAAAGGQAQPVEAIDRSALRVCADPAAMPFSTQEGEGFENKIAALLAQDLGVPVQYTWFPNTIGFYRRTLNARRCDIVIGAPAGIEMAATTQPYYRSTFAVVTRAGDHLAITRLGDPALRGKRVGVQARTPAADLLAKQGLIDTIRSYDLLVDSRVTSVGRQMIDDLGANRIDAAVLWGPVAAYQAGLHQGMYTLTLLGQAEDGVPLAYDIAMAVRTGEPQWRARIDRFIKERAPQIRSILVAAEVPLQTGGGEARP